MEKLELKPDRWRIFKNILLIVLMTFVCFSVLSIAIEHYNDVGYQSSKLLRYKNTSIVVSIFGIIFFGGGGAIVVIRMLKNDIKYTIDSNGIKFEYSKKKKLFISWEEVSKITKQKIAAQTFIGVELKNIDAYKQKYPKYAQVLIEMNRKLGYSSIMMNMDIIGGDVDKIITVMNNLLLNWEDINK